MDPRIEQKTKKIFDRLKDIDTLWVTEDGQVFVNKAMAMNHAYKDGALRRDKPLNVEMVKRSSVQTGGSGQTETETVQSGETETGGRQVVSDRGEPSDVVEPSDSEKRPVGNKTKKKVK